MEILPTHFNLMEVWCQMSHGLCVIIPSHSCYGWFGMGQMFMHSGHVERALQCFRIFFFQKGQQCSAMF
jgi:hypothetical protein